MAYRFQAGERQKSREFQDEQAQDLRDFRTSQLATDQNFRSTQAEKNRSFQLQTSKHLIPVDQQDLPAGMPYIYDRTTNKFYVRRPERQDLQTLKGRHYYHQLENGKWVNTGIRVPEKSSGVTINTGNTGTIGDPLDSPQTGSSRMDFETMAEQATGLWANVEAGIDALAGGVGIDTLFGKEGFFKDTQDARQNVRILKQLGKSAFMNSQKGPIWEQKIIQELFPNERGLFVNPRTEARKIPKLRTALEAEREYKINALKVTTDKILARDLRKSITDIDRIRNMLGKAKRSQGGLTDADNALIQKYISPELGKSH
jgi:predicted DNA binding CopG/RHH family protein